MTRGVLEKVTNRYLGYVNTFRDVTDTLPRLLQLKMEHSNYAAIQARDVMIGEGWEKSLRYAGDAASRLHDIACYVQFHAFGTFRDSESFDHADAGAEIIQQKGWLAVLPEEERNAILAAVRLHNKHEIPPSLTELETNFVHMVRDADKLDIFRMLEMALENGLLVRYPEIIGGLPMEGEPTPEVIEAVCKGEPVNDDAIRVFADFVLAQVGWLNGGLHFKTTARLTIERQTLEFREKLLKTLATDHSGIECCCGNARHFLAMRVRRTVMTETE